MQCCPLMRALPPLHARPGAMRDTLYRLVMALAARLGWYRLERLLGAIPNSNDDFMIF